MIRPDEPLALIGYGYWGKKLYSSIQKLGFKNVLVVDPYLPPQTTIQTTNIETILQDEKIKHVFVATPEETHFDIVLQLLSSQKNVFVEKPLSLSKKQAQQLITSAKKNRVKLFVDYIFLFDPYVKKIKELLNSNLIGVITNIFSQRYSVGINKPTINVYQDLAMHDIYLFRHFVKKIPNEISITPEIIVDNRATQGHFFMKKNGLYYSAHYSWENNIRKRCLYITGEKGSILWDRDNEQIIIHKNDLRLKKIKVIDKKSPLELIVKYFLHESTHTITTYYRDYLQDVSILEKITTIHEKNTSF